MCAVRAPCRALASQSTGQRLDAMSISMPHPKAGQHAACRAWLTVHGVQLLQGCSHHSTGAHAGGLVSSAPADEAYQAIHLLPWAIVCFAGCNCALSLKRGLSLAVPDFQRDRAVCRAAQGALERGGQLWSCIEGWQVGLGHRVCSLRVRSLLWLLPAGCPATVGRALQRGSRSRRGCLQLAEGGWSCWVAGAPELGAEAVGADHVKQPRGPEAAAEGQDDLHHIRQPQPCCMRQCLPCCHRNAAAACLLPAASCTSQNIWPA